MCIRDSPNIDKQIDDLPENLIFRFRKYLSIGNLLVSDMFKNRKVCNFYEKVKVCYSCYHMYKKIDQLRNSALSAGDSGREIDLQRINKEILKIQQKPKGDTQSIRKNWINKMSDEMYDNLAKFDPSAKFRQTFKLSSEEGTLNLGGKSPKNETKEINMRMSLKSSMKASELMDRAEKLPALFKTQVELAQDNITIKTMYAVKKEDSPIIGLKFHLGSTTASNPRLVSKSTGKLNTLSSKIDRLDQGEMQKDKQRKKEDNQRLRLLFCPYFGNGKEDSTRLKSYLKLRQERGLEDPI
eukprot:TRINITY_DN6170_c0_g2_i2.p1 TRINITY_DN6170_c0_g2~~TRINITY_DN6170_c0_g2_i2.p1  ORF type:complete len:297 (+),score=66.87 TRINITY_DN6170_c0_g2_i2:65-955(+)